MGSIHASGTTRERVAYKRASPFETGWSLLFGLAIAIHSGLAKARVNIAGGGVALGHPIGASGARVLTTLIHQLRRAGGKRGVVALCLGGGNAVARVVEVYYSDRRSFREKRHAPPFRACHKV